MVIRPHISLERLTDAQRKTSLHSTLSTAPVSEEIYIFAYGSMMWNPLFEPLDRHTATLVNFRRSFCVWSQVSRGSAEVPGLALGLEQVNGTSCQGIVFQLSPGKAMSDLKATWERELFTAVYQPKWLKVTTDGREIYAIAFIVDTNHPQYAPRLGLDDTARIIIQAVGENGTCLDYLVNTARELAAIGCEDPYVNDLYAMVEKQSAMSEI